MIMQIYANICQTYANICKYMKIYANICKCMQIYTNIYANVYKLIQISVNICKYIQICANICKYTQIYARCPNFHFPELFGRFEFRILNSLKNYLGGSNFELRIRARFICRLFVFRINLERNYDRTFSLFQGVCSVQAMRQQTLNTSNESTNAQH